MPTMPGVSDPTRLSGPFGSSLGWRPAQPPPDADVAVSALTGSGLRRLLELIELRITDTVGEPVLDEPALTHARHRAVVARATGEVHAFADAWREDALPATVAAVHVHAATDALGELIGDVRVDDVLDVVFRRFCVGK